MSYSRLVKKDDFCSIEVWQLCTFEMSSKVLDGNIFSKPGGVIVSTKNSITHVFH